MLPKKYRAFTKAARVGQSRFMLSWGDADDRLLEEPGMRDAVVAWLAEGARQGSAGVVRDWVDRVDREGFSVAEVQQEVHVWIGQTDWQISRSHGDYLGGRDSARDAGHVRRRGPPIPVRPLGRDAGRPRAVTRIHERAGHPTPEVFELPIEV